MPDKRKPWSKRKLWPGQIPTHGNLQMKHPIKGISVVILNQGVIVFEATARVAPEKQTESLPADALLHDS